MVAYKKFEFDNFVIEDEEIDTISPTEIIVDDEIIQEEVEPIIESEFEPEFVPEIVSEPVVETITFSEEELEAAKIQSEQIGYDKGYQTKSEEIENMTAGLLLDINNKLSEFFATQDKLREELEQNFMKFNLTVLQKLLPDLNDKHAVEILNRFLDDNFANFRTEPKLSFFFNPEIAPSMQQQISKLARLQDFEGKISLHKDATLGLSDCKIEWDNGGVVRSSDKLLEKVNNLLEENALEN